jgi:Mn2+/Fe2+ NRAMP family transporter
MSKVTSLSLGVLTALGGFVDMGELVTCSQAGATFQFSLLWTVAVGVLGIMVFTEMTGRVAIASGRGCTTLFGNGWAFASASYLSQWQRW